MKNTYGVTLYAVSVQNEPDVSDRTNPACGPPRRFTISCLTYTPI